MFTSRVPQDGANAFDQVLEIPLRFLQLLSAGGGELVVLRLATRFGLRPGCANPAALLHAVKSGVQGPFLDAQEFIGCSLDMHHNAVAVKLSSLGKRLEHE